MRPERILLDCIALLSIFILPWWTAVLIVCTMLFRFTPYYEAFVFGLLLDVVYMFTPHFSFTFTFSVCVLFFVSLFIKDRIRIAL